MHHLTRSYPFVNTPISLYLAVMAPICLLMGALAAAPHQVWIRISAAMVIIISAAGFARGFLRRAIVDEQGLTFRRMGAPIVLQWRNIKRIDVYSPTGSLNGPKYVFASDRDSPPAGVWQIDESTIQLQDRPGLLDELRARWSDATARMPNTAAAQS